MCRIVSDVDILEVKVAERALNLEAIPANSIAMGAARNERHIMPRRCHSPAEISSGGPCCHNRDPHNDNLSCTSQPMRPAVGYIRVSSAFFDGM